MVMTHRYINFRPLIICVGMSLLSGSAQAANEYRFDLNRIGVSKAKNLRSLIKGKTPYAHFGASALHSAGITTLQLAQQIHRLMPAIKDYDKVFITPGHVALQRKDGIREVLCRHDAMQHILRNKQLASKKIEVGIGWRGSSIWAEKGPNKTIFLYRQLPQSAKGQISSTDGNTSFALGKGDAMHPFGAAGPTVKVAVPVEIFNRAVDGKEGAVGWNNYGDGYSTGLEVLTEVQLSSSRVGKLFN